MIVNFANEARFGKPSVRGLANEKHSRTGSPNKVRELHSIDVEKNENQDEDVDDKASSLVQEQQSEQQQQK